MYLHVGENVVLKDNDIIGIFDLDNTTVSKISRDFLEYKEKQHQIVNVSEKLPKSFLLCTDEGQEKVYISQISPMTLYKRSENFFI